MRLRNMIHSEAVSVFKPESIPYVFLEIIIYTCQLVREINLGITAQRKKKKEDFEKSKYREAVLPFKKKRDNVYKEVEPSKHTELYIRISYNHAFETLKLD